MSHDDFESEPIPGLPALPPEGESVLWQGSPHWPTVARRVMHVDLVAAYLAVMIVWRGVSAHQSGASIREVVLGALPFILLSLIALGVLSFIAWRIGRTTIYTITNRRVVMRFGIALPVTFNLPFRVIASADLRDVGQDRGDIALRLTDGQRLAHLVLWPHVRPWRLRLPEPMLRALPDARSVANVLGEALAADTGRKSLPRTTPERVPDHATSGAPARPVLVAAE